MSRPIQEIGLADLLPSNLTSNHNVSLVCTALDEQLRAVNACLDGLSIWANQDNQPDEVLDLVAWENSVEGWSEELPKVEKIRLIQNSTLWKQRKGTLWVIRHLLSFLPYEVEIVTYQEAKKRYHDAGGRFLDGTWKLDGTQKLVSWSVTGLPTYKHWAEFCVLATTDAEGWKAIKEAVDLAKRGSSWALWIQVEKDVAPLDPDLYGISQTYRQEKCRPWKTPLLDRSWTLDGTVSLGERDVEITGELQ